MWWSSFPYDKKGPYHIWKPETKKEKADCKKALAAKNAARYQEGELKWKLENAMERIHITWNQPGERGQFKHDEKTGAYVLKEAREESIGIDIKKLS